MRIFRSIRKLAGLLLLLCSMHALALSATSDEFQLSLSLTRGERSRDSHSSTTLININQTKLTYDKTFRGRRGNLEPVHKEFQISQQDIERLRQIIEEGGLLKSDSLTLPNDEKGYSTYFGLSLKLNIGGRESLIKLSGPRRETKIKGEPLFRKSETLVQEIYKLIRAQDKKIIYEGMVN